MQDNLQFYLYVLNHAFLAKKKKKLYVLKHKVFKVHMIVSTKYTFYNLQVATEVNAGLLL